MRSSKNMRLMSTDLKRLQKSLKQKTDKQVQSLIQLIDLPDFDVSEFFQTLMRSSKHEQVLQRIPTEKQIQFFSRNYITFIETQDQLSQLKLPELQQIPKAKQFKFQEPEVQIKLQDADEQSVVEIIDSFGAVVLQKNTQEVIRILQIINEMKQHSRYQKYFSIYSINQLYRQSYETFIETCEDKQILVSLGLISAALKKYLKEKATNFINKIRNDMNIDNSTRGIKKIMERLNVFIQITLKQSRQQFAVQKMSNPIEADVIIPKFISDFVKQFYQTIQPCIYEKQELSEILEALQILLESSNQLESKGINLARQFRQLISQDLPIHMNKIIQVVIEAFDDILKQDNSLYQFKYFDSLGSLGQQVQLLAPIKQGQYGKKCCSKKGILLINAFVIILEPLCDDKWIFLQQNVLGELLDKVSGAFESNWHYWDYNQLFYFFQKLRTGKIKHKKLFNEQQVPISLKQKMTKVEKISIECWDSFQTKLTNKFWMSLLVNIPKNLWQIRQYIQSKGQAQQKPTLFSMDLVFSFENFIKQFQFRLQKPQFQFIITRFYEYIIYIIQYVLYFEYHGKGTKQKVFSLYKKSQKIYKKAKNFSIQDLQIVKQGKNILKISMFTKAGVKNFALDIYFFTQALKVMTEYQKFNCQQLVQKIAQIQSKEHKTDPINVMKQTFNKQIQSCVKVYKEEPQKIRQYMEKKRKDLSRTK